MKSVRELLHSLELDFSAKVRWRMRFDRNPLFVTVQDKYAVRQYAAERGVKSPKLLYVTDRPETIPFDDLPSSYMLKANHGCNWNILCHDSELYLFKNGKEFVNQGGRFLDMDRVARHKIGRDEAIALCREWMGRKFARRAWAYLRIRPRIMVEELLVPADGGELKDYKVFVFGGKAKALYAVCPSYRRGHGFIFFDTDWNAIKLTKYKLGVPERLPERPSRLGEILAAAERLGAGLDFVRADFYDTVEGIVLGEITIYPSGGKHDMPTACPVFNLWLGDQWRLSIIDKAVAVWWNLKGGYHRQKFKGRLR